MKDQKQFGFSRRQTAALVACALGGLALVLSACPGPTDPPGPTPVAGVTFDLNGGTGGAAPTAPLVNGKVTLPTLGSNYSKLVDGVAHSFAGWSDAQDAGTVYPPGYTYPPGDELIMTSRRMYAAWYLPTAAHSQITFDWGLAGVDNVVVHAPSGRDMVLLGADQTREGYVLLGWDTDLRVQEPAHKPGAIIQSVGGAPINLTLYAIWGKTITVTFNANGAIEEPGNATPVVRTVREGSSFNEPVTLFTADEHFTFHGWDENPALDYPSFQPQFPVAEGSSNISILADKEMTLYAIWYRPTFTVSFEAGIEGEGSLGPLTGLRGEMWTAPVASPEGIHAMTPGWNLTRWDNQSPGPGPFTPGADYQFTATLTLVAFWMEGEPEDVTITLDGNGGTPIDPVSTVIAKQGGAASLPLLDATYTREWWDPIGWSRSENTSPSDTANLFTDSIGLTRDEEDFTLYAVWHRPTYRVIFEANGGAFENASTAPVEREAPRGETVVVLDGLTRNGFTLYGWNTDPDAKPEEGAGNYRAGSAIQLLQETTTLYAVWEANRYEITYDPGEEATGSYSGFWYYGEDVTLYDGDGFNWEHHDLVGWSTMPGQTAAGTDGENGFYGLESTRFVITGDVTLHAVWYRPTITLTFDANFPPHFPNSGSAPGVLSGLRGTTVTAPLQGTLSVNEHTFIGWGATANATSVTEAGEPITLLANATLYAIWNDNSQPNMIVTSGTQMILRGGNGTVTVALFSSGMLPANIMWSASHAGVVITGSGTSIAFRVPGHILGEGGDPLRPEVAGTIDIIATYVFGDARDDIVATHSVLLTGQREAGEWRHVRITQDSTMAITWGSSPTSGGELWTWGRNGYGQLGIGSTGDVAVPTQVGAASDWLEVNGGIQHALGIRNFGRLPGQTAGGTLWAWGRQDDGRLGNGQTSGIQDVPVRIGEFTNWTQIAGSTRNSYGIRANGQLYAWGSAQHGALGDGQSAEDKSEPQLVGSPEQLAMGITWRFASVSAAVDHAVAVRTDGTLWTWGRNNFGQMGQGSTTPNAYSTPVEVEHPEPGTIWVSASAGYDFTVALDENGKAWAWGWGSYGRLGDGGTANRSRPVEVAGGHEWTMISAGHNAVLALDRSNQLWAWGQDTYGQSSGRESSSVDPHVTISVPTRFDPAPIAVLDEDGEPVLDEEEEPVTIVLSDSRWISINGGGWYSLAVSEDGSLWAWGTNGYGQLGIGNTNKGSTPDHVPSITPTRVRKVGQ